MKAHGAWGNAMINSLWQQAAAQGMTVLVASGDSGAAGCSASSANTGSSAGSMRCARPLTAFAWAVRNSPTSNTGAYWNSTVDAATKASARQYIPESTWNESGIVAQGSGLWASGGGASVVYAKPAWQAGTGVPADNRRDVPDVSLSSSGHDGYLVVMNGGL